MYSSWRQKDGAILKMKCWEGWVDFLSAICVLTCLSALLLWICLRVWPSFLCLTVSLLIWTLIQPFFLQTVCMWVLHPAPLYTHPWHIHSHWGREKHTIYNHRQQCYDSDHCCRTFQKLLTVVPIAEIFPHSGNMFFWGNAPLRITSVAEQKRDHQDKLQYHLEKKKIKGRRHSPAHILWLASALWSAFQEHICSGSSLCHLCNHH